MNEGSLYDDEINIILHDYFSKCLFVNFGSLIHYRPKSVIDFMRWMKWIVTYPRTAMNREKVLSAQYRAAYECAHRVVLLSKGFIKPYSEFAKLQDTSKFTIIPNGLSFNLSAHYEDLTKHKVVLIVSRLDETQKRLSLALRIWKKVKQNPVADGWVSKAIGTTPICCASVSVNPHASLREVIMKIEASL